MTDRILVQRLGPADAAALVCALEILLPAAACEGKVHAPEYRAHLVRALATPSCYVFLATEAGTPVGYVSAYRFPRLEHASDQAYVFDIEVAPAMRRRGVGRRLLEALLAALWREGVTWAWAGTAQDNRAAQELFEGTGGRRVGETYIEYHFEPPR